MDKKYDKKYCIIMLVDKYEEFEFNVTHSKAFCNKDNVQVLIIDRSCEEDAEKIKELVHKNEMDYHRPGRDVSIAMAYNEAVELVEAEFICFSDAKVLYDDDTVIAIDKALYDMPLHKIAMLDYAPFSVDKHSTANDAEQTEKPIPAKFILNERENVFLFPYSYFISRNLIGDTRFKDFCEEESAIYFLIDILLKVESVAFAEGYFAYYTQDLNYDPEEFYGCRNKKFYTYSLEKNLLSLLEKEKSVSGDVPLWLKKSVIHILFFKYFSNYNRRDKFILIDNEIDEFFDITGKILGFVDDEILNRRIHYKGTFVHLPIIYMFAYLKHGKSMESLNRSFYFEKGTLFLKQTGVSLSLKNEQKIVIQAINVDKSGVSVEGFFHTDMLYKFAPGCIYAELNGERKEPSHTDIYSYEKCFGRSIDKKYTLSIKFKIEEFIKDGAKLAFVLELGDKKQKLPLSFLSQPARLNENYRNSYWKINKKYYLKYDAPFLKVLKAGKKQFEKLEDNLIEEISIKERYNPECENILSIRGGYHRECRRLSKKNIWIHYDKMYKAGDNGEYLFRYNYAKSNKDKTDCYFIISTEAEDYKRLKNEFGDSILEYGSFKCRLYALCAQAVISTSQDIFGAVSFNKAIEAYFRDLFNAKIINISHGVTMQKNADSQNRLKDNVMLYCTSSKYEVDFICKSVYGYDRDKHIALTGMARFDGLKDKAIKQILITPTWRPHLTEKLENRVRRNYFSKFRESDYFRIYNKMINDDRLLNAANEAGYKITFLIHTGMTANFEDYCKNDIVSILRAGKDIDYETVLTESSLMITDYSGVQYDFAYMKKPIIYYQPHEIPPRLKNGAMDYETMGFGPVVTGYDDAVDCIIEYMKSGCLMKPEYVSRVEKLFYYMDFSNCKRLHDAIKKFVNS